MPYILISPAPLLDDCGWSRQGGFLEGGVKLFPREKVAMRYLQVGGEAGTQLSGGGNLENLGMMERLKMSERNPERL